MPNRHHITILTSGTRGDVQPYLALGLGLRQAGYSVKLAAPINFDAWIRSYGLDFAPIRFNPQTIFSLPEIQQAKDNLFRLIAATRRIIGPILSGMFNDFWDASQSADALIISPAAHGAYDCAEKLDVPIIVGWLQPIIPTGAFPSFGLPLKVNFGGLYNRLTHLLFEQMLWQSIRPYLTSWRKRDLDLPSSPFASPYARMRAKRVPNILGYSSCVVPKPTDWPAWCHVTGYWFLPTLSHWQPPSDLVQFLNSGPPPIAIGFGSMSDENPKAITKLVLEALSLTNQRAIFLSGWGDFGQTSLPETVFTVSELPHDWLFPRTAAIVHHGGAGTTGAGLRAGIPSIVTPFGFDQHHWADTVVKLGVGPRAGSIKHLTAERLASCVQKALTDENMRERAATLGACIQAEDGVAQAVAIIQAYLR